MATGLHPNADAPTGSALPTRPATADPSPPGLGSFERVFYRLDYRRVTLVEFWREHPRGVAGHALRKLLRARTVASSDDPCVHTLVPFELPRAAVPGVIAQRLSMAMSQFVALGFRDPIFHAIEDDVQRTTTYLATMPHESGRVWARVHNRVWHVRTPATSTIFCELVSELAGGRFIWSLSSTPELAEPRECTVVRLVGATPNQLLAAHQSALAGSGAGKPLPIHSTDELRESLERHHARVRGFHVERGVFAPVSADDHETATQFRDTVQTASAGGSRYPEILAEIATLQNKKGSGGNGLAILLVSIALFVGAGLTKVGVMQFSPDVLLILVGVLFFHETGHWVAMRLFGYRNLKMFFIPFFGAAVTGRHSNVAGWKKVIVSLMGPVPGIVVGAGLGAIGVWLHIALLTKIALVAIALNALNLIPILPFDGGWVVHAILFSRHHLLELAFRVSALAALFLLAALSSDRILIAVAIAMSLSLPTMYRVAKITNALRRSTLPRSSEDGQTLPPAAAEIIVDRIKAAFPAKLTNRMVAQHTLQVFESVNARPPRAMASLGLGALHVGSIVCAAAAAMAIYAGASAAAWHQLDAVSIRVVRALSDSALAEPRNTVFGHFATPAELDAALDDLRRNASSETAVASFGGMAVISVPFEDVDGLRVVQTALEKRGSQPVISTPTAPAMVRLSCTATSRSAAMTLDRELGDYFLAGGSYLQLLPPWQPSTWSSEERARHVRARRTLRRLQEAQQAASMDPRMVALRERMRAAQRADERLTVARLESERGRLSVQLRSERVRALRAAPDADTAVIDASERMRAGAQPSTDDQSDAAASESFSPGSLAPLLGTLPLVNGHPATGTPNLSASGPLVAASRAISMPSLRFENVFQGPPALARWLLTHGCTDLRYAVETGQATHRTLIDGASSGQPAK